MTVENATMPGLIEALFAKWSAPQGRDLLREARRSSSM